MAAVTWGEASGQSTKAGAAGGQLKVFISYSRRDLAFADQLVAVLDWQGFEAIIDRKGIHGAENWEQRLGQLILSADIAVFVLSPDSAASEVCAWEVEEAARRGKRIVPVLCRPLEGAQPHRLLRDLNYVHFYEDKDVPSSGFGSGLLKLVDALSVDVAWLREHTRLEELAARWEGSGRSADMLLRGSELGSYKAWRDRRPAIAPELTVLQRAFLGASEEEEEARAAVEEAKARAIRDAEVAAARAREEAANESRKAAELEAEVARERADTARRIAKRTFAGLVASLSLTLVAAGVSWYAWTQRQEAVRQAAAAENEALAIFELKYNLHQDHKYSATVTLTKFEQLGARNDFIRDNLEKKGFKEVSVTGDGATRKAVGIWDKAPVDAGFDLDAHLSNFKEDDEPTASQNPG